ncbi:MAG TPA: flagellar hook protein FlgE [Bryobacteraceae bacterium]|nr:flagellar hook protein FlgE [Bryobacteraceae bacterium]
MFTSFSTALSALAACSTAIDVVGNNLANLNTVGFKTSEVSFHDLVTQSIGAGLGDTQVGFGVGTPTTLRQFTQGAVQTTGGSLDAAIQGDGFFLVQGPDGSTEYTRAGNFQTDEQGNLMTATGQQVQGWTQVNGVLNTNAPPANITIPTGTIQPPVATQNISFDLNLNAAGVAGASTGTFATSVTVYDSLGNSHIVTATFTKDATNPLQWDYSVSVPDADVATPPATPLTGNLVFNSDGSLNTTATTPPGPLQFTPSDNAAPVSITWNLMNGTTPRITQYAQASSVSAVSQDGSAAAQLTTVAIATGGQILAQFSNGQQVVVGELAMATIRNPDSLIAVGNNNYQLSADSALPAVGLPGTGGRGTVEGGAIESSTVDIATEFTNLIVYQRGYEANSKVVTTVDQLSQDTINLMNQG